MGGGGGARAQASGPALESEVYPSGFPYDAELKIRPTVCRRSWYVHISEGERSSLAAVRIVASCSIRSAWIWWCVDARRACVTCGGFRARTQGSAAAEPCELAGGCPAGLVHWAMPRFQRVFRRALFFDPPRRGPTSRSWSRLHRFPARSRPCPLMMQRSEAEAEAHESSRSRRREGRAVGEAAARSRRSSETGQGSEM